VKAILSVVFASIVLLSGCQFKTKWRDTTGQRRPDDLAEVDARNCYDASGYAALNTNSTNAELETFKAKLDACMADKGWVLVRDNST
jgi:hypothetical protein